MKILVLNGSPRPKGNTAGLVAGFVRGAEESGHTVTVAQVCRMHISGCLACEYCHQPGSGHERQCAQKDDMQQLYPALDEADMLVLPPFITMASAASSSVPSTASMRWTGPAGCGKRRSSFLPGMRMCTRGRNMNTGALFWNIWAWKIRASIPFAKPGM